MQDLQDHKLVMYCGAVNPVTLMDEVHCMPVESGGVAARSFQSLMQSTKDKQAQAGP